LNGWSLEISHISLAKYWVQPLSVYYSSLLQNYCFLEKRSLEVMPKHSSFAHG